MESYRKSTDEKLLKDADEKPSEVGGWKVCGWKLSKGVDEKSVVVRRLRPFVYVQAPIQGL
jgi:hypothetical protein